MSFAPLYLLNRFFFRLSDFFHHWYIDGSRRLGHGFISFLQGVDRVLALRVTLHYFWRPLYGDYTIIGRVLGVIFRAFRILIALSLYILFCVLFALLYLVWLAIPFVPLFMAYKNIIGI
jgi:hypothetical protein